jgi:hypothetical protein
MGALNKYGMHNLTLAPAPSDANIGSGASNGAVVTHPALGRLNPENPMLWLLGIGAVTLGLIGATTSVRFGPIRGSASVGKA